MRILVVGSGGREHALAWKLASSPVVSHVFVAPGNGGTATEPHCENVPIPADDVERLVAFARTEGIQLAVIGPEKPLVLGLADALTEAGIPAFGPSAEVARLEGSKAYAKELMSACGVKTAAYATFEELEPALEYVRAGEGPIVVKADGLAGGKGVVVCADRAEAEQALRDNLEGGRFGDASARVIVEDFLEGPELSYIVIASGTDFVPLASSQDHKRLLEGDEGPNTGGMGAFTPVPFMDDALERHIQSAVIRPVLAELERRGTPFVGFLYAGLMLTEDGPYVLEFNVRCGDPETEALMIGLDADFEGDLVPLLIAAAQGRLAEVRAPLTSHPAACVVLADGGYPGNVSPGHHISGLSEANARDGVKVFHCGTRRSHADVISSGGRVLCVAARGESPQDALSRAYAAIGDVHFETMRYRTDIGGATHDEPT
ncbi:MAG: phosphoribosylamine--glycine ligase [Myxococcales bacterium]|nr:phosphoribosylamine--glycine ligase [Myxococcales bacterium]